MDSLFCELNEFSCVILGDSEQDFLSFDLTTKKMILYLHLTFSPSDLWNCWSQLFFFYLTLLSRKTKSFSLLMDAELAEKLNRRIRRIESIDSSSSSSSSHVDELDFSSTINFKSKHFNRRFSSSNAQNLRNIFEQFEQNRHQLFLFKRIELKIFLFRSRFDIDGCEKIDLHRLKFLMEKLGLAQTHVRLKDLIRRFANDRDGLISFRDVRFESREVFCAHF